MQYSIWKQKNVKCDISVLGLLHQSTQVYTKKLGKIKSEENANELFRFKTAAPILVLLIQIFRTHMHTLCMARCAADRQ